MSESSKNPVLLATMDTADQAVALETAAIVEVLPPASTSQVSPDTFSDNLPVGSSSNTTSSDGPFPCVHEIGFSPSEIVVVDLPVNENHSPALQVPQESVLTMEITLTPFPLSKDFIDDTRFGCKKGLWHLVL